MTRWRQGAVFAALLAGAAALPAQAPATPKKPAPHRAAPARHAVSAGIAPARAEQIQQALVAAGYLDRASGHWDAATAAAMKKYQDDHRWQTRFVPDARALIALGLDPQHPPAAAVSPGG